MLLVLRSNYDYHYEDGAAGLSDYMIEYLTGEYWAHGTICGVFECASNVCLRGPDSYVLYAAYVGSQTNIIMTIMVMLEKLSMKHMVVNR